MRHDMLGMKFFIVQSTEQDINLDLSKRLAALLAKETGLTIIEARHQLRYAHGIFEIGRQVKARRISEGFARLGLDNFVLEQDEFVTYPPAETLDHGLPRIDENIGLVAAGAILKERLITEGKGDLDHVGPMMSHPQPLEFRKEIQKTTFIDIYSRHNHFRVIITPENTADVEGWLRQVEEKVENVYLGKSAREIPYGKWDLVDSFPEETSYDRYLRWLIQLRYNERSSLGRPPAREQKETPWAEPISPIRIDSVEEEAPEPSPATQTLEGKQIDQYKILGELGEGGMGIVYKAEQTSLERTVAMKVLPQRLTNDPAFVQRFLNEARAIAALNHPNIVQIYDVGHEGQTYYYTMELVDGRSLDDILFRRGSLPIKRATAIVANVALALEYMHGEGVVHRDVKPSNIMLDRIGGVKLTDFGLALQEGAQRMTVAGGIVGTPEYMSPEQAAGHTATSKSDIYSLGVVFYELTTGRVPFEANTPLGVIGKIQSEESASPRAINSEIPPEIERIILRMMARDPERRYESCQAILKDLRRYRSAARVSGFLSSMVSARRVNLKPAAYALLIGAIAVSLYFAGKLLSGPKEPDPLQPGSDELTAAQSLKNETAFQERLAELDSSLLSLDNGLVEFQSALRDTVSDTVVLNTGLEVKGEIVSSTVRSVSIRTETETREIPRSQIKSLKRAAMRENENVLALQGQIKAVQKQKSKIRLAIKGLQGLDPERNGDVGPIINTLQDLEAEEDWKLDLRHARKSVTFGPLSAGQREDKKVTLFLNGVVDPRTIRHELSAKLPPGLSIRSKVRGQSTKRIAEISVSVDPSVRYGPHLRPQATMEVGIRFKSSMAGVAVTPAQFLIRIVLDTEPPH